jgi:hypothetical protein
VGIIPLDVLGATANECYALQEDREEDSAAEIENVLIPLRMLDEPLAIEVINKRHIVGISEQVAPGKVVVVGPNLIPNLSPNLIPNLSPNLSPNLIPNLIPNLSPFWHLLEDIYNHICSELAA